MTSPTWVAIAAAAACSHPVPASGIPLPAGLRPLAIAAADVDGDGRVDVITDSWAEGRLVLLRADPGGWREPGEPIEVGRKPYINIVTADFDADGNVDLAVPNQGSDTVTVLFGDGRGG